MAKLVSQTYGEALFELANEQDKIDVFTEEIDVISEVLAQNPDFSKLMNHPKIDKENKLEIVDNVFLAVSYTHLPKKRLEIDPCVFPWNAEYLDRSDVIMRLAICASALRDEDKITHIAEMLQEIDISHYSRDTLLLLLVREPANDRQREILVDAVADKETYTRQDVYKRQAPYSVLLLFLHIIP